jgi:cellulose 1,4-beta-cellobiosidase
MDIWEANSISQALTPHSCSPINSPCTSDTTCGSGDGNRYSGYCDKDGCDFNPFRMGNQSFYGPGKTVDSKSKITVVTQFITSDNTASGDLVEIRRLYVQGGKVYQQPTSNIAGITGNAINDKFCSSQKTVFGDTNDFAKKGGLKTMGDAFEKGMVLVMSIWDDYDVNMLWLDSEAYPVDADPSKPGVARGTCSTTSGKPGDVESQMPGATVTYSNIKTGPIGSTYSGALQPGGGSGTPGGSSSSSSRSSASTTSRATTTSARTTTTTSSGAATTSASGGSGGVAQKYAQCGVSFCFYSSE